MESNDSLEKYSKEIQSINFPPPRFGHTVNIISKKNVVLFGGAININNNKDSFIMTSDLYLFDMNQLSWKKLDSQIHPKARGLHASVTVRDYQIFYYGGLTDKGQFSKDGLWSLKIRDDETPNWTEIITNEQTPGPRYGHSMAYMHNNIFLYGGYSISKDSNNNKKKVIMNDVWIFTVCTTNKWIKLNIEENPLITARLYHTFCVYSKINRQNDVIILFGGRDSHNKPLNDLFSLTRKGNNNNNNNYIWECQTSKNDYTPISRYEHSATMLGPFLFIMGGKSTHTNYTTFEVFSFISNCWYCFGTCYLFRHTIWIYLDDSDSNDLKLSLYIYGGFDNKHNGELNSKLFSINIFELFSGIPDLKNQLTNYLLLLKNCNKINWKRIIDPYTNDNTIIEDTRDENNSSDFSFLYNIIFKDKKDHKMMNMLEEKIITKDMIKMEETKKCIICLEDYVIGKHISYLPCCHSFHSLCIKQWLYKSKQCPLCKTKV